MCGAPGERRPPTGGPRPGIEEADRWDPSTDIFGLETLPKQK
jgi:hypothetical protein